ncbi:MAG: McrC family protein [Altibacter sp.]|uniref:5-methylcytosine restriction system specificity protein McrC n=1 Tax=Altibacter sp. TaxID=2024823 RepID=UPI001D8DD4C6|nr:restriction endonuclease [Altibacter sp.]MBZ0326800.1 McrC family protein [Altibacter sp.]
MPESIIHINENKYCYALTEEELVALLKTPNKLVESIEIPNKRFQTGYFIGLSWLADTEKVLYVTPKLDSTSRQIDYLSMLSESLKHPEIVKYADDLFKIEFDQPPIKINQQQDLITPLIVVYFLQIVQVIIRKGLKKGYFKVEKNLYGKVKGKIRVSQTLKQNAFKSKNLNTICSFNEFGLNHPENRILKKALLFLRRYLKMRQHKDKGLEAVLNFILPAFEKVNENISNSEVKSVRHNPFYSEYSKAVELAIIILKRFGFNINFIKENEEIEVPPFWINMPLIFELYVLGKLKDALGRKDIIFQSSANYGELDFLRVTKGKEMVIDSKYKPQYKDGRYEIEDIRQLSAYARDKGTLSKLSIHPSEWGYTILNCLIVYPDQTAENSLTECNLYETPIKQFEKFYRVGISIPEIPSK